MQNANDFIIVNGVKFPPPDLGFDIVYSQTVDASRNADISVVGQKVGRRLWKINNLQWTNLDAESWTEMKAALVDFFVLVTFTGDDNKRHTIHMYPSDTSGKPLPTSGLYYTGFETCKFNLIDCGWDEE